MGIFEFFKYIFTFVCMNRNELISKVKESVKSIDMEAQVILYGSRSRGDENRFSDWDFLILTPNFVDETFKNKIRSKLIDTELEAEEVISTIIFSNENWNSLQVTPLYKNISRDGIRI